MEYIGYLHFVVDKRKDGIIVRGCKLHISEASVSDELLVFPTRALRPEDKDYAVAFAVPGDYEGVTQVVTIHNSRFLKNNKKISFYLFFN
jgi:aromatic ring hydroxylase